ncbi:hypothetical protein [Aneurinibacillus tyrosinisolvens]|uniref:hypothetical protein n=1 Tax=Aneurinibacillus tyrosinisolvens TaxID=1443435 RepID=UPI00063F311C|nr:hypothetical protein [Aneurinibacillus tyrosinisolvens]
MLQIQSDVLMGVVNVMAKSARKAALGERLLFIKTTKDQVSFYFNGTEISVEKRIDAKVSKQFEIATTVPEIEKKVSALPKDETIEISLEKSTLDMKWGRGSKISVEVVKEKSPLIEIPELVETVRWGPNVLHGIARMMTPFAAPFNPGMKNPSIAGPNFQKDALTGEVFVRATDAYKGLTISAGKMDWFSEQCTIDTASLNAVAEVIASDAEVEVGMNEEKSLFVFRAGNTTAVAQVIVGAFPNIDGMYNTNTNSAWHFDRQELLELCRRVKKLAAVRQAKLEIRIIDGKVHAVIPKVLKQQLGVSVDGTPVEFAVNAEFLELAANVFRTEDITLHVPSNQKPLTLTSEEAPSIKALVAQMMLNG